MIVEKLFAAGQRTNPRPKRHGEGELGYLDRVGPSQYWEEVRALLNDWLEHHPDSTRLRPRFKKEFDAAFWELYVHELFHRLGFTAVVEPFGARHRPDFAFTRGTEELRVECWMSGSSGFDQVFDYSQGSCSVVSYEEHQISWLAQVLDDHVSSPDFGVIINRVSCTSNRPAWRLVSFPVQRWVDEGPGTGVTRLFEAGEWSFVLERSPGTAPGCPFVQARSPISPVADRSTQALATGLLGKAKKEYQKSSDDILLIAANWPSTFLRSDEVEAALFGAAGLWSNGHSARVSAVLLGKYIQVGTVGRGLPELWVGPRGLPITLPFETHQLGPSGLVRVESTLTPRGLFGLPDTWGTADPFPGPGGSVA